MANHFNADKTNNNLQQQPADSRSAALYVDESAANGGAFLSTDDVDHDVDDEGDEMLDEGDVGDEEEVDEEFLQQHDGSLLLQTTNQNHSSSGNTTTSDAASSQQSGVSGILTKQTPQQQQHALAPGLQTQQQRKIVSSQAETAAAAGELANNFGQNVAADTSAAEGGDASSILEQQQASGEEGDDQHQYTDQQELLDYDDDDENADFEQDGEGLADMRSKIREMEQEADKLRHMQTVADKRLASKPAGDHATMTVDEKLEIDTRSVYVGNVDYGATAEELEKHFHACGNVVRVTILCDKFSGHPKGFAYIEFGEKEAVDTAVALDESMFRGRQIKVSSKRTNQPGISTSDRGRGRGGIAGRGGRLSRRPFRGGFGGGPTFASRGRGFSHGFAPYRAPRGRRPTRSFHYRGAA